MARTKTTARKSTGGRPPRKQLATAGPRGAFAQVARQVPKSSETSSTTGWVFAHEWMNSDFFKIQEFKYQMYQGFSSLLLYFLRTVRARSCVRHAFESSFWVIRLLTITDKIENQKLKSNPTHIQILARRKGTTVITRSKCRNVKKANFAITPAERKYAKNACAVPGNAWFKEWQCQVYAGTCYPRKQLVTSAVSRGTFAKVARQVPKVPKFSETPSTNGWVLNLIVQFIFEFLCQGKLNSWISKKPSSANRSSALCNFSNISELKE